jgi:hypothetical protein
MATINPQSFTENVAAYGETPRRATPAELVEKKIASSTMSDEEKDTARHQAAGTYLSSDEYNRQLKSQGSQSPYVQAYTRLVTAKTPQAAFPLQVAQERADADIAQKQQAENDRKLRSAYYGQALAAGMGGAEAVGFADKAMVNEVEKRKIQLQQGLLSADQERLNLENAKKDLNRQNRLTQFQMALNAHDPLNIAKANDSLHQIEKKFPDLLADASKEGAPIAKMARDAFKDKKTESDAHAEAARNYVQRYGIDLTPDLLDKKTGYLNYNAADQRGIAMMAQREKEAQQKAAIEQLQQFGQQARLGQAAGMEMKGVKFGPKGQPQSEFIPPATEEEILPEMNGIPLSEIRVDSKGKKVGVYKQDGFLGGKEAKSALQGVKGSAQSNKPLDKKTVEQWKSQGMTREEVIEKAKKDGYTF